MTPLPLIALLLAGILEDEGPTLPEPVFQVVDRLDPVRFLSWDWTGLDGTGQPVAVDRVVYKFRVADGDAVVVVLSISVSAGTTSHRTIDLLATVPAGRYRAAVQMRSTAGVWGAFSEDIYLEVVDGTGPPPPDPPPSGPAAPTGLRLERREAP